jgi:hypothetical protein
MQSKETWTLWEIAQASESANRELRNALQVILLTRDGTVPLDSTCPSLKEARLGPANSYLTHAGIVVAADGSVPNSRRKDGGSICSPRQQVAPWLLFGPQTPIVDARRTRRY